MLTDPKPNDCFTSLDADGSIISRDPSRIDRERSMDTLEMETGMVWIVLKNQIDFSSLPLNRGGQTAILIPELAARPRNHGAASRSNGNVFPNLSSSSASSASLASIFWDF